MAAQTGFDVHHPNTLFGSDQRTRQCGIDITHNRDTRRFVGVDERFKAAHDLGSLHRMRT